MVFSAGIGNVLVFKGGCVFGFVGDLDCDLGSRGQLVGRDRGFAVFVGRSLADFVAALVFDDDSRFGLGGDFDLAVVDFDPGLRGRGLVGRSCRRLGRLAVLFGDDGDGLAVDGGRVQGDVEVSVIVGFSLADHVALLVFDHDARPGVGLAGHGLAVVLVDRDVGGLQRGNIGVAAVVAAVVVGGGDRFGDAGILSASLGGDGDLFVGFEAPLEITREIAFVVGMRVADLVAVGVVRPGVGAGLGFAGKALSIAGNGDAGRPVGRLLGMRVVVAPVIVVVIVVVGDVLARQNAAAEQSHEPKGQK